MSSLVRRLQFLLLVGLLVTMIGCGSDDNEPVTPDPVKDASGQAPPPGKEPTLPTDGP